MKGEIIPVIHMLDEEQVILNVCTCISEGIKKVFLINHNLETSRLLDTAQKVKTTYPELWVGVNLLGVPTEQVIKTTFTYIDAIWVDDGLLNLPIEKIEEAYALRKFKGMLFGGLAFKYQKQPVDLKESCERAIRFIDVPTTSGVGTGKPANKSKIEEIRNLIGNKPLALASGVDIDNISDYVGLVDYYLVASSITGQGELIDEEKLSNLRDKLLEFDEKDRWGFLRKNWINKKLEPGTEL